MTEIMQSSSTSCTTQLSPTRSNNDGLYQQHTHLLTSSSSSSSLSSCSSLERKRRRRSIEEEEGDQLNIVRLFLTSVRRSVLGCSSSSSCEIVGKRMEIGWPSNVRHVAHVTFDRFNGFLGLPVEFEPDVPRRAPSASTTVFGVSTNSMQLSFDTRGNSVPTILLLMQHRLYALGGLQMEGIFRINADNGQEEYVRDQLNRGLVPDDVDIHCLAGLIKAWFRELPTGVLDCLSPEQVMESQTEEECTQLARLLPPTEAALLDWAINLMADVAQCEHLNKMNARNVAMVFAPNMTHMADPLTALMHAVQVMNFLKTLVEKTLKEREDSILDSALDSSSRDPSAGSSSYSAPLQTIQEETNADEHEKDQPKPVESQDGLLINENIEPDENEQCDKSSQSGTKECRFVSSCGKSAKGLNKPSCGTGKAPRKTKVLSQVAKTKGTNLVSNMNLRTPERIEAWR